MKFAASWKTAGVAQELKQKIIKSTPKFLSRGTLSNVVTYLSADVPAEESEKTERQDSEVEEWVKSALQGVPAKQEQ
jgi:hypothetical protein